MVSVDNLYLGPLQSRVLSLLERSGPKRVTFEQVFALAKGSSRATVRNVVAKLVKKGRLQRIKKGVYLLVPFKEDDYAVSELSLVNNIYPGGYVSFLSALRFHGLTDQLPVRVQVAVKTPSKPRKFQETSFQPVKLSNRYFIGYTVIDYAGAKVNMALKEKAILDCLLHPEYCGGIGEACKALQQAYSGLDWKSVVLLLKKMDNSALERRLAFGLNFLGRKRRFKLREFKGFRKLDASQPNRGEYNKEFGLRINVDLREEMQ